MMNFNNLPRCFGGYLMKPAAAAAPKWGANAPASVRSGDPYYGLSLPRYAKGGDLTPNIGRPVLVGEEGPELVVPTAPAAVMPAGTFDAEKARRLRLARNR